MLDCELYETDPPALNINLPKSVAPIANKYCDIAYSGSSTTSSADNSKIRFRLRVTEFFKSENSPKSTLSPSAVRNSERPRSRDCCSIKRNLMIDDFPALFLPIRIVIGRNLTVTSSSKIRKLVSLSSVSIGILPWCGQNTEALNPAIVDDFDGNALVFTHREW